MRANFARAAAIKCVQSCSRVKSATTKPAGPDLPISAAAAANSDSERAHKKTDAPSWAKWRAIARPIPRPDPVISATLSFSNMKSLPAMRMRENSCFASHTQALWVLDRIPNWLSKLDRGPDIGGEIHSPNHTSQNKTGGPCFGHPLYCFGLWCYLATAAGRCGHGMRLRLGLRSDIHLDLLRLGFFTLWKAEREHTILIVGPDGFRFHGVGQREAAAE